MTTKLEIIATRTIDVVDKKGNLSRQLFVHIGKPLQEPTGEWSVPYQVAGVGRERVFKILGLDAVQALYHVHLAIGSVLASLDEAKEGRLRWSGQTDLGFPTSLRPRAE